MTSVLIIENPCQSAFKRRNIPSLRRDEKNILQNEQDTPVHRAQPTNSKGQILSIDYGIIMVI